MFRLFRAQAVLEVCFAARYNHDIEVFLSFLVIRFTLTVIFHFILAHNYVFFVISYLILVHVVHGNVVPQRPEEGPVCGPGDRPADLILDEAQDVEEGEDGQVDVERQPPVLEDGHGDVLNLPS